MWSNVRFLTRNILSSPKCFTQPERSTYILKRKFPIRLNKLGASHTKRLRRRNFYYTVEANTDVMKKDPLAVVLIKDVPGVGSKGDKIELNMFSAYRDFILPKLALYADLPEAIEYMEKKVVKEYSSVNCKVVEKFLSTQALSIMLSAEKEWKLEKWHVKFALRKIGIVTHDECVIIPKEITGPNLDIENKDFLIQLVMNKQEKFFLRCRIYHWSASNPMLNKKLMDIDSPSEPLFSDEKEKIDEILKYCEEVKRKKMMRGLGRKLNTGKKL